MIAAVVRIAPLDGKRDYPAAELRRRLWLRVGSDERINHIYVRAGPGGFDVLAFVATEESSAAHSILRRVVQECLGGEPRLRLWRIV